MLASLRAAGRRFRARGHETYLKVRGRWVYLYRAVDKQGKTVESYLSRTRDVTAAKAFFRKALKRHGEPTPLLGPVLLPEPLKLMPTNSGAARGSCYVFHDLTRMPNTSAALFLWFQTSH